MMNESTIPEGDAGADFPDQTWFENTNTVLAGLLQTVLELHERIKVLEAR